MSMFPAQRRKRMENNVKMKLENEIELLDKPQTEKELRVSPPLDVSLLEPGSIY